MFISALLSVLTTCLNYIWTWFTPFWIIIYVSMSILPSWITIYNNQHLEGSPELNEKYHAFARTDYKDWNPIINPLVAMLTLAPIKTIVSWVLMVLYVIGCFPFLIGHKLGKPLSKFRVWGIKLMNIIFGRLHLFFCGVLFCSGQNATNVDYKKYLGPEWKPKFTGAGIAVPNHQCWLDILALMNTKFVCFVAKEELSKIPVIS
jgi:hypothetical protein